MTVNTVINLSVSIEDAPSERAGFGVPVIFADFSAAEQTALFGVNKAAEMTADTWQNLLAGALIASTADIYQALLAMFSQIRKPPLVLIAWKQSKAAQVETVTVTGATDGLYRVIVNGEFHDFTASSSTVTAIRDALVTALGSSGQPVTAAPVSTDQLTITADNAGEPFTVSVQAPGAPDMAVVNTTPSAGLADDVDDLDAERSDWYLILDANHNDVDTFGARAAVAAETSRNIAALCLTSDANAQSVAVNTDPGPALVAFNTPGMVLMFDTDPDQFPDMAIAGKMLPTTPGTESWGHQTVVGPTGIVPTSENALKASYYGWCESYTAKGVTATRHIRDSQGNYFDLVRFSHYHRENMQSDLFDLFIASAKVPNTPEGRTLIETVIRKRFELDVASGAAVAGSLSISIPSKSEQSATDIFDRVLNGITYSFTATNGIEELGITGTIGL